jgi:head-tail adaptor
MDPCVINPGELRHPITIQKPSRTGDSRGKSVTPAAWDDVLNTHAKIDGTGTLAYRASFANNALASTSTDMITLRFPGVSVVIKPNMRIVFGTNIFLVQAVDNVQHRNRILRIACMQVSPDSN